MVAPASWVPVRSARSVLDGSVRSPSRSPRRRSMSALDARRTMRAGLPTATLSSGMCMPAGTSVRSPRNTRLPSLELASSVDPLPTSHRSPTVVPMSVHRWPKTVRWPIVVVRPGRPTTTEFSSTADPVPTSTPRSCERTTAPSASSDPSPRRAVPTTTEDRAVRGAPASDSRSALAGPALMGGRTTVPRRR